MFSDKNLIQVYQVVKDIIYFNLLFQYWGDEYFGNEADKEWAK